MDHEAVSYIVINILVLISEFNTVQNFVFSFILLVYPWFVLDDMTQYDLYKSKCLST